MKHFTSFTISKKPGAMALVVETAPFSIRTAGTIWKAERDVDYRDSVINIYISIRGQKGQEFEMKMKLNSVEQEIKGILIMNGINQISLTFNLTTFFPSA